MSSGPEAFVNYVQLQIVLKKKPKGPLQMLEEFSPEWNDLSAMPLIGNLIWEMIIHIRFRNKGIIPF